MKNRSEEIEEFEATLATCGSISAAIVKAEETSAQTGRNVDPIPRRQKIRTNLSCLRFEKK